VTKSKTVVSGLTTVQQYGLRYRPVTKDGPGNGSQTAFLFVQ
jgi:hypothetical protein